MPPAPAPFPSIFVAQWGDDPVLSIALARACEAAFGAVSIARLDRLADAPPMGSGVLLLCEPTPGVLQEALAAQDADRLPRWGVVVLGVTPDGFASTSGFERVERADWQPSVLSRALRSAAIQLHLRRENACLRDDFATYGMRLAHDLRTPLGGVLTSTEMLREVLAETSPDNVPFTAPILESADGLVKLIDRISFFARANADRGASELLDMGTVFWNAFQRMEGAVIKAGASLTQAPTWPNVRGHGHALEVVWQNLISNALEHGGAGVRLAAGWGPVPGGHRFWLTSTSRVSPEKRATLFFAFNRLHEPGAPRGLGLPIVRRLVEADGGTCGFGETAAGDAEFFFVLPAVTKA